MRRDEPIAIFVRTAADGTRRAVAIGQSTGTFAKLEGYRTLSALLDGMAKLICEPPAEEPDQRIRLLPGDVP